MGMKRIFEEAYNHHIGKPYKWPDVSCVSMIEWLSDGMASEYDPPNYSKWKSMSEKRALAMIRKLSDKPPAMNYLQTHWECMGEAWHGQHNMIFKEGDVVFFTNASGNYNGIEWESLPEWPVATFVGNDNSLYTFLEDVGLVPVDKFGIRHLHLRRRDW